MDYLDHYGIPVYGMQYGAQRFNFNADESFFKCFEDSPISKGKYQVVLDLDKRENEFVLNFNIKGYFNSPCDRCLADIEIPSSIEKMVWIKYSDQEQLTELDEDYLFIDQSEHIFNVAELIYEFIILSFPLVKRYDCENDPNPKCDFKVLSYLENDLTKSEGDSIADKLKNLRNL